jgi:hypothetical protein
MGVAVALDMSLMGHKNSDLSRTLAEARGPRFLRTCRRCAGTVPLATSIKISRVAGANDHGNWKETA